MSEVILEELVEALRTSKVEVVFTKKDGSERIMKATLMEEYFPAVPSETAEVEKKPRAKSETSISVWDLEKHGWRSFRKDSVTSFRILPLYGG